ncbi:uncharacterized protein LOC108673848 [Hyalella azteca]|uniref:Uncharacterized protein LOC108673848 n=1 Tax=Hyalella azteca TaxID=294128 RepID=A0A8B7NU05_HYAAZ|nr:uncharacterized protein LOC108673848 [Hyalella azteca]
MDITMHDMKKCRVVMHKLPDDAVKRGWWSGLNLPQVPVAVCKVESDATDASGSSMLPDMVAANIKLEPVDKEEALSVKDEPVDVDEYQQTPPSSSCVPCKEEAQVEARDAHRCSSQDAAAVPEEQCGKSDQPVAITNEGPVNVSAPNMDSASSFPNSEIMHKVNAATAHEECTSQNTFKSVNIAEPMKQEAFEVHPCSPTNFEFQATELIVITLSRGTSNRFSDTEISYSDQMEICSIEPRTTLHAENTDRESIDEEDVKTSIKIESGITLAHYDPNQLAIAENSVITVDEQSVKAAPKKPKQHKRPKRPCPFCQKKVHQLPRHLKMVHRDEPEIQHLNVYSHEKKIRYLTQLRKRGIFQHNKKMASLGSTDFICEQSSSGASRPQLCISCKGFYNRKSIARHKCTSVVVKPKKSIILPGMDGELAQAFLKSVVTLIRDDEIGMIAKNDHLILSLGLEYYKERYTQEKELESCLKIRSYIRNLAKIVMETKRLSECKGEVLETKDVFKNTNIDILESAIHNLVTEDGNVKHGMKVILGYDLNRAIQDLLGLCHMTDDDEMFTQLQKFQNCFKLRWRTVFLNSERECKRRRFETFRRQQNTDRESIDEKDMKTSIKIQSGITVAHSDPNKLAIAENSVIPLDEHCLKAEPKKPKQHKRPKRPCPFCQKKVHQLPRHLKIVHRNEPEIQHLNVYSPEKKIRYLTQLRKRGIFQHNKKIATAGRTDFICEQSSSGTSRPQFCTSCKGFYNRKSIARHKCTSIVGKPKKSIILPGMDGELAQEFLKSVVTAIRDDEIGLIVKNDQTILSLGLEYYKERYTQEKEIESCLKIRSYMRNLAKIVMETKRLSECKGEVLETKDVFKKTNLCVLESAIHNLVTEDGNVKHGMKVILGYDLNRAIQDLLGLYCMADDDEMFTQLQKFQNCFKLRWRTVFLNSERECKRRRFKTLRRPENQISKETLQKLRNFAIQKIRTYQQSGFPFYKFVDIRNAVFTSLVLYNAGRSNEISRMKVSHVKDALSGKWLPQGCATDKHFVCYVPGKHTTKPVSLLLPVQLKEALVFLTSEIPRNVAGIAEENLFCFPSLHNSLAHVQGTNILARYSNEAGTKITGTQIRHCLANVFASEETNSDKSLWRRHMGRSETINKMDYKCPRDGDTAKHVSGFLQNEDRALSGNFGRTAAVSPMSPRCTTSDAFIETFIENSDSCDEPARLVIQESRRPSQDARCASSDARQNQETRRKIQDNEKLGEKRSTMSLQFENLGESSKHADSTSDWKPAGVSSDDECYPEPVVGVISNGVKTIPESS